MAEERESIRGSDVRLDDRSVAVLHRTPMAQWGDRSLVPAGNEVVLQVAEECIKNSDGQEKGQALAGRVLQDPRIQNAEILFLVPLNGHGKKMRLEVSREAWQTREELFVFTSPQDDNDLKVWLKEPINTLMKTMLQSEESGVPLALPVSSMNETRSSSSTIRTPTNEMCKRLQDMIKNADGTLDDMKARVFNDRDLEYGCLKTLEDAQGQTDKAVWSRHWAGKLQEKDQEALDHSDRRRTLLFFLRKVCDLGLTKEGGIAEGQLEALQSLANILTRIYEVVLPMDRANALYCLHNTIIIILYLYTAFMIHSSTRWASNSAGAVARANGRKGWGRNFDVFPKEHDPRVCESTVDAHCTPAEADGCVRPRPGPSAKKKLFPSDHRLTTPNLIELGLVARRRPRTIPQGLRNQLATYFPESVEDIQSDLPRCIQEQSVVKAELREILANQDEYRERMQDQQLEAAAAARDTTKVAALRQMKRAERERKEWSQINRVAASAKTGITSIEVPSNDNPEEWVVIDTPSEVEKRIIERNRKHFGQAQGTAFTEAPLSDDFKWDGGTASADLALEGAYDAAHLPEPVQDILARLCKPAGMKDLPPTIGMATWHQRIKQWRETTTTSPSGRHLGHYKICAARHDARRPRPLKAKEKPDEAWWNQYNRFEELRWTRSQLSRCYVAVMNYATRFGYSLKRWRTIVNIMIPKEERNRKITRLRVIHIYEADYNLAMSIHWNTAVRNAELHSLLADEQYGGRKDRTAHDPVLIEELENEILRLSRHPIARMDIDATACYDRILLNLANLASRAAGLPSSVTKACAETLQEAGFRLLTALGISEEFYRHCDDFPIYGSGQGSGNSPSFWLLISSIILRAHKAKANGVTYVSPMVKRSVSFSMSGFVDDVNNRCNVMTTPVNPKNIVHVLAARLASDSQLWNDLLEATGGALNLSKCSYHLCHYSFSSTGIPTLGSTKHEPIRLHSRDHPDGVSIRALAPTTPHKTLGYYMAPSGNDREQVKVLQQKSREMAEKISLAHVSRGAATKYYHAVFVKSVGYCSDITHISQALWKKIQKPFLRAVLPKMGFNRCHPRAALLGPLSHGGLGLTDFWVLQGAHQACLFLAHFRQPDTTIGQLLRITLDWAQFNAGVSWPILKFPKRPLPHLEGNWIKHIREFAANHDFHYRLRLEPWAVMLRQGDCPIMDLALLITTNKTTLSRINYCRLYLQVRLVSEVVSASGETMLQAALKGRLEDMPSAPIGVCAIQERPNEKVWGQWRSMWRKISTRKGRLFQPLGKWYPSQICRIRKWNWYYSTQEDTLFQTSGSFFYRHPVLKSGGNRYEKVASLREIRLPPDAVPVDRVVSTPGFLVLQPYRRRFPKAQVSPAPSKTDETIPRVRPSPHGRARIKAFLRGQAPWLNSLHEATRIWQPPSKLQPWFEEDQNMVLSVHPHYHGNEADTTGWCLGTEHSLVATGFFRTSCDHNRGRLMLEILGLLQGITAYIGFRDYFGVERQHALNLRMFTSHKYTTEVCITFARPIFARHKRRAVFEEWPLFHLFEHFRHGIRTHLPEFKRRDKELKPGDPGYGTPRDQAFLSLAWRAARIGSKQPPKVVPLLPKSHGDIVFHETANVVGNLKKAIIAAAALPQYQAYIEKKYDFSAGVFEHIDWNALEVALSRRRDRNVFFHKLIHGWLPLGPRVKYYDPTANPLCPFCNLEDETFHHLLACRNQRVEMWRCHMLSEMIPFFENPGPADQSRYLQQCVQQVLSGIQLPP